MKILYISYRSTAEEKNNLSKKDHATNDTYLLLYFIQRNSDKLVQIFSVRQSISIFLKMECCCTLKDNSLMNRIYLCYITSNIV